MIFLDKYAIIKIRIYFNFEIKNIKDEKSKKMSIVSKVSVIIPSLNPDEKLMRVVRGLEEAGFDDIIIVNDGSNSENLQFFPNPEENPSCKILTHEVNRGKGAALKTAFDYFLKNREGRVGVVTVDGDDQHRPIDVLRCAERMVTCGELVLGVRDFSLPHVPKRSRHGNKITSFVFRIGCGLKISDTQTGLRAIPTEYLPSLCQVSGDRFEYETNMLLSMKTYGIPFSEVKIETVYIEENKTSHFRPFHDSIRIYSLILKFMLSSAGATLVDLAVFYLSSLFLTKQLGAFSIPVCTVIARAASSICNFEINRKTVFKDKGSVRGAFVRYYALAIPLMLVSAGLVWLFSHLFEMSMPILKTLIKALVDTVLFFVSFNIQREWVFASKKKKK